ISVSNCLLKALAIERDQRYSSALEMQKALKIGMTDTRIAKLDVPDLSHAETVASNFLKIEAPTEILPIQPLETQVLETQPSMHRKLSETDSAGDFSGPEFTAPAYLNLENQMASEPQFPIAPFSSEKEVNPSKKKWWIIPIITVGFLAISGIGSGIWLMSSATNSTVSNKSVTNQTVFSTPISNEAQTTVTTTATATPLPTQSKPQPTKTVAVPTPNKASVSPPPKTPSIKKNIKPQKDPNCVFTNSCE
ncbi:MAG TPA: hypothetical protein PKY82_30590, partial [Pyrinomonadaceae bacterium]|nr:hypothetical protein [Pyrinomonadaceae bacterium]